MKLLDTNILLDHSESIFQSQEKFIIHSIILEELDNIVHNALSDEKKYKARQARNKIKEVYDHGLIDYSLHSPIFSLPLGWDYDKNDNNLLRVCKDLGYCLVTNDLLMQVKADCIKVSWEEFNAKNNDDDLYLGYKEVTLSDYEQALFYQEGKFNKWDLLNNQYLIIKNEDGEIIDKLKWTIDKGFKSLSYKTVDNRFVGKVKPRNLQQELYMDMLQDKEVKCKVVQGGYGTGKDYLALSNFLNMVDKGQFQRIIWIRNNVEANGTKPIGYLPGSLTEKLSVFADIVSDFVGDNVGFETLLREGKLELVHTGFLRGRDFRNSIIYCTEAQNMSDSLVKLVMSRVSENSIVFFNGDIKQADNEYLKKNNGLNLLINKLKGNKLFGYVKLEKCERGEVAELASLLDE